MAISLELVENALNDLKKDSTDLMTNSKFIIVEKFTYRFFYFKNVKYKQKLKICYMTTNYYI